VPGEMTLLALEMGISSRLRAGEGALVEISQSKYSLTRKLEPSWGEEALRGIWNALSRAK